MLSATHTDDAIIAVYQEPFSLGTPHIEYIRPGKSLAEIVEWLPCLPPDFKERGSIVLNGTEVPRNMWKFVRPKAAVTGITFHMPLRGGGNGNGAKAIVGAVAALALVVASAGVASGAAAPLLGDAFAAGTWGAKALAVGVSLAGSLLINALTSSPVKTSNAISSDSSSGASLDPASISGNALQQNASVPRVIGTRRIYPPFAFEPTIELIGQDEYVTAIYALAGPHLIQDIRFDNASLSVETADTNITVTTFDGFPGSTPVDIPNRYSRTTSINVEMSVHGTDANDLSKYSGVLPVFHSMATAEAPDQVWLHLLMSGLITQLAPSEFLRIPLRIRMRKRGDASWRYLPEIHYMDNTQSQRRLQIKFFFHSVLGTGLPTPPSGRGFVEARKVVPAQNVAPFGTIFNCDSYFSAGSGNDIYRNETQSTTNVRNITLEPDVVGVYLDNTWPDGTYEIEIKRGGAFLNSSFSSDWYTYSGTVYDFFTLQSAGTMPLSRSNLLDKLSINRIVSVKNNRPIDIKNLSLIKVVARNRSVNNMSVLASGYVNDWDATKNSWTTVTTTSNPAPHYRDILSGILNFDPLPDDLHDIDSLVDWRHFCFLNNYTCDLIVEGMGISELLRIVAACGRASPYQSERWGVIVDYNRSSEGPTQTFTPRNMANFKWKKAFTRLPAGLRVNFKNKLADYQDKQIVVFRSGSSEADSRTEQITYDGIVSEDKAIERAKFDMKQAEYRPIIYSFDASVENIVCRRGSLIAVNHDTIIEHYGYGRIVQKIINSGQIIGVVLDSVIEVVNTLDVLETTNFLTVTDVLQSGIKMGISIRNTNGDNITRKIYNSTGNTDTIYFVNPIDDLNGTPSVFDGSSVKQITEGCLVSIGTLGTEYIRMIVTSIVPGKDLTATITAVDEAPQIWS